MAVMIMLETMCGYSSSDVGYVKYLEVNYRCNYLVGGRDTVPLLVVVTVIVMM